MYGIVVLAVPGQGPGVGLVDQLLAGAWEEGLPYQAPGLGALALLPDLGAAGGRGRLGVRLGIAGRRAGGPGPLG